MDGEDSRTLATVGAFRVVPEHDLDIDYDTLEHLHDSSLDATYQQEEARLRDEHEGLEIRHVVLDGFTERQREFLVTVSPNFASWNRLVPWLRAVDELRRAT